MKKDKLEFFYDCSSPWTYLAFSEIENLSNRHNLELIWKPILVGGVFNSVNPSVYESRANPVKEKRDYSNKDLQDWCKVRNIEINWPKVFPVNSVKAMRGAIYAIDKGVISEYSSKVFYSYWTEGKDISQPSILSEIINSLNMNEGEFFSFIEKDSTKETLKSNTQDLMDRGGFGSPTIFVNESDMFFGNDRLYLIDELIKINP
tara:strand:- start:1818 stop:2429 length:612 start_codon:yes stop_codon:yes gene_type:complete